MSAVSLLELALLASCGKLKGPLADIFRDLQQSPQFRLLPVTSEIATEAAALGNVLRDPSDRAIVATAQVHRLRLVTSDQRIIESKLVPVID